MVEPGKYRRGKHTYIRWGKRGKEVKVMSEQPAQQKVQMQIQLDDETAQGVYSNLAFISHSETEFTLDFIYVQPQKPVAKVRSRIISSPAHTKRFLHALTQNIKKYEDKFGPIKAAGEWDKKIGF